MPIYVIIQSFKALWSKCTKQASGIANSGIVTIA